MTTKSFRALGHLPARTMNKTEREHSLRLEAAARGVHGVFAETADDPLIPVMKHKFEALKFFIGITPRGRQMWYCPDFFVVTMSGELELHEVKGGYIMEDSYVKLTAVAQMYPMFRFVLYQRTKSGWHRKAVAVR